MLIEKGQWRKLMNSWRIEEGRVPYGPEYLKYEREDGEESDKHGSDKRQAWYANRGRCAA